MNDHLHSWDHQDAARNVNSKCLVQDDSSGNKDSTGSYTLGRTTTKNSHFPHVKNTEEIDLVKQNFQGRLKCRLSLFMCNILSTSQLRCMDTETRASGSSCTHADLRRWRSGSVFKTKRESWGIKQWKAFLVCSMFFLMSPLPRSIYTWIRGNKIWDKSTCVCLRDGTE